MDVNKIKDFLINEQLKYESKEVDLMETSRHPDYTDVIFEQIGNVRGRIEMINELLILLTTNNDIKWREQDID